jgi:hypothetical protein
MKIFNRMFLYIIQIYLICFINSSEDNSETILKEIIETPEEFENWDGYLLAYYLNEKNANANYFVIDPTNYIDNDELLEKLNEKLGKVYEDYNFNTFTIIVNSLDSDFNDLRVGLTQFIKEFKYYLIKNNENLNEDNLIIILFDLEDEYETISVGKEVKKKLTESEQNLIITKVRSKIRNQKFEYLNNLFDDLYYYMDHCDDCVSFWVGIGFFIFFGIAFIILMIIFIIGLIRGKRVNEKEEKKIKRIEKILNEFENENNQENKKKLIDNICFICMYNLNEKNIEEKKEIKDTIKEISCGHKFHNCCWDDWVIKNEEICPICTENLKYEDSFDDFEKKIINIQRNIHKDFNEIKFKYNKKKLTYKFIDFNNKETIANLY